ncbi:epoxyqueuosine reductase QueH [Chloroflexota bacterium]
MKSKSVLVHCCCAHCAAYTLDYWRHQGYQVSILWYNPNIHPYMEHQHRLEAMEILARETGLPLVVINGYDIVDYFRDIANREDERCRHCFRMRLMKTAETARDRGFEAFTTSLLISPHQKHELLKEISHEISEKLGVGFLCADLRKRYSDSRHITRGMNIYRQQYCGCVFSEWERYTGRG